MAETTKLKDRIRSDMNAARRGGAKDRARLLSTILSDIRNREIDVGHELEDEEVVDVLAQAVKLRIEAAESMAARPERAEAERTEAEILREYLPPQLEEEEIREIVVAAIDGGATNIGAVMGAVMPQVKGRAEGKEVNRIVREELEGRSSGD
ncbi:MAG: GatB/YqeY domain-containing protein [Gemmatimonadetes bacterium]|uniref:GatB/YqeY domain-containing protein n=1 Tax=Candidatus Kutchimonas denitrificans TaxID=3056748 RepID=A0AAE4ZA20_9BACT|nr:GatB/YqeY domain-containing protein [Gemmatimonadota bacterium]NIR76554.1 GatB/YqeY domain-containing protein [Candidatus Kutchimonas denitrificans]NIS01110.1 GatB/YqeY domain-containing protein [Gemmatimonadota bacterium]NIT66877.1 GatB/YqeY domain-containing protein [Gemmatimonadota bacterium]NIU54650.1 GatB/YqeY domain-containing protein [Gemmatimonadota bacterium]